MLLERPTGWKVAARTGVPLAAGLLRPVSSTTMSVRPSPPCASPRLSLLGAIVAASLIGVIGEVLGGEPQSRVAAEGRRLQEQFNRAASAAEREGIAAGLLGLGTEGGRRLHASARSDFLRQLPKYSADFQRAATDVLRRRAASGDPAAEVAALRQTIRDVAARADLTEDVIVANSDPALARLEALLVVSAADVFAAQPSLAARRAELLQLATWAERAAELVPAKERGKLPPLPSAATAAGQLEAADELAALLAGPLTPADRHVLAGNAAVARDLDPEEARGIQRLNQIRIVVGLPAQAIDRGLVTACRVHSEDMATKGFFDHESPVAGRETPWKRAEAAGTSAAAENIAAGTESGVEAIRMWWHSPGHHRNMLGGHQRTGLGRSERHWTQLFG